MHLCPPIYGRTIYVHEINDLRDIAGLLSNDNQVIGLELKSSRRDELAKLYLNNEFQEYLILDIWQTLLYPGTTFFQQRN